MKVLKFSLNRARCFSSSSERLSALSWISPIQYSKTLKKLDPPPEATTSLQETPRKQKFISHELAVNMIIREKDPQRALETFNKVSAQKGFCHNNATYSAILHQLAQCKKFSAVDAVIRQMKYEPCKFHEAVFLNLMKHFAKSSLHHKVIEMFDAIHPLVREKPSRKAISTCLNILVESDQMGLAEEFLLKCKNRLHLEPNTCIFNILVKHHCKNGDLESAFQVVEEMKKFEISYPNLVTYSTLMSGLCENGRLKEAADLFEEMIAKEHILPDALTYNTLINGFCQAGKIDRAQKILGFMRDKGCAPNIFTYATLMSGLCKEGKIKEAEELFDEMKSSGLKPDKVVFTTLISYFCQAQRVDEAVQFLQKMRQEGCKPDAVTFNVVIGGLCRERRVDVALRMLEMLPYEGIFLNKSSYRITLNFLCKYNEIEKAFRLLGLMLVRGFTPHFATSNQLLLQLCEAGRPADARIALEGLLDVGFNPEPSSWVLLIETVCRERKLLPAFELLDHLTLGKA